MKTLLLSSLVFVFLIGIILFPSANALPVSYNTTTINLGLSSNVRNSTVYDVFMQQYSPTMLWLKFDNNLNDASGNQAAVLVRGSNQFLAGVHGNSYNFTRSNTLQSQMFSFISSGKPFTISYWLKMPIGSDVNNPVILDTDNAALSLVTGFTNQITSARSIVFKITNGSASIPLSLTIAAAWPNNNDWQMLTYSFDGTTLSVYKNSTLLGSQSKTGAFNQTVADHGMIIGARNTAGNNPLGGQMDDLIIVNTAWSSTQVSNAFNSQYVMPTQTPFTSGWYRGTNNTSTLTKVFGDGSATINTACSIVMRSSATQKVIANNLTINYLCPGAAGVGHAYESNNIFTNTNSILWHMRSSGVTKYTLLTPFPTKTKLTSIIVDTGSLTANMTTTAGNFTLASGATVSAPTTQSNQKIQIGTAGMFKWHFNGTALVTSAGTNCDLLFLPTNTTKSIDGVACDSSLPANTIHYWNGMSIQGSSIFYTNSTFPFLTSIDANTYKKILSIPCTILVNETPCSTFILTDYTNTQYLIVLTSTHIYYKNAVQTNAVLVNNNYALQSYDIITQSTSSIYEIPSPILQSMKLYGPINFNITTSKTGLFTLTSGYTVKTTSSESAIRTIDPRWSNDATDIPIITSTSSLFPIFLTVSNAPVFSAIKVTNPYQLINSQESVWAISQLDSTRTVEFDIPPNVCVNIYIADISVSPSIWNFQGIICSTGVNQKTISYTNTLPFTFWTYPWGASDSFTPSTNILTTTVRHTTAPFTYNLVLKNSTGGVFQNSTITSNSTINIQSFNLTGKAKPVSLYVNSVTGGIAQIYSAFLGSPISLASTASFFNQYFSYQGFNLLAFIPIIFASMFTRNTIGIGVVLTVLCIATLSWLSVVVIPELDIMIMIVIAIIGLIAYRLTYY